MGRRIERETDVKRPHESPENTAAGRRSWAQGPLNRSRPLGEVLSILTGEGAPHSSASADLLMMSCAGNSVEIECQCAGYLIHTFWYASTRTVSLAICLEKLQRIRAPQIYSGSPMRCIRSWKRGSERSASKQGRSRTPGLNRP
jgi:hypothetical protein